jgi:arylsulfatase
MKNVILIVIDALRARNLSCYGYPVETSPNIDNLAREGVLFDNAYCCVPATDPSLTTIFSGKYPISHGIINHGSKVTEEEIREFNRTGTILLPEILKSRGYATVAIDWLGRWHRRGYTQYGVNEDKFRAWLFALLGRFRTSGHGVASRRFSEPSATLPIPTPLFKILRQFGVIRHKEDAKTLTDRAIGVIRENRDRNFSLFIHYWDTHTPYMSPRRYVKSHRKAEADGSQTIEEMLNQIGNLESRNYIRYCMKGAKKTSEAIARYDGAIAFVDDEIGRLVEALRKTGILDQTLIMVTSDHGESLTEHGIYFTHHGLYDETIHVPLIVRADGLPKNKRVKGLVQHVDVAPTILEFLDIETEIAFDGKSLLPLIFDETRRLRPAIYIEEAQVERKRAIRTDEYKYISALSEEDAICRWCGCVHGGMEELYDLKRDPEETNNIITENPDVANVLRKQLSDWTRHLDEHREMRNIKGKVRKLKSIGII